MKILKELPPAWIMDGCMSQFRVNVANTYWTYGDTIYNPGGRPIAPMILEHEALHSVQQANYDGGPEAWWKRYLIDPAFRLEQELQAHAVEYHAACLEFKDRNRRARILSDIAGRLSGPLYQAPVDKAEAVKAIRSIAAAL